MRSLADSKTSELSSGVALSGATPTYNRAAYFTVMFTPLRAGDTVAIVSPASPLSPEAVEFMTQLLEGEGYRVVLGPNVFKQDHYLAGSDAERAQDLMWAFSDASIQGIVCSRGGYGCARLFPHLDLDQMAASGKLFAGFSDVTTLHLALNRRGLTTLHSPMALTLKTPRDSWVYESFKSALRGDFTIPGGAPTATCAVEGQGTGTLTGGCLCLLTDSIGTPDQIQFDGKIVLIEDVDETPHRVDAMLTHLLNAGLIQQAAGIVIGEMTRTDETIDAGIGGRPWREIVLERLGGLGIPMVIDFPFGHAKQMRTLPLGQLARLNASAGSLEILS